MKKDDVLQMVDVYCIIKDICNMKKDMLKMIDAIEMNEMHIKQLNWKIGNRTKLVPGGEGTHQEGAKPPNCS